MDNKVLIDAAIELLVSELGKTKAINLLNNHDDIPPDDIDHVRGVELALMEIRLNEAKQVRSEKIRSSYLSTSKKEVSGDE